MAYMHIKVVLDWVFGELQLKDMLGNGYVESLKREKWVAKYGWNWITIVVTMCECLFEGVWAWAYAAKKLLVLEAYHPFSVMYWFGNRILSCGCSQLVWDKSDSRWLWVLWSSRWLDSKRIRQPTVLATTRNKFLRLICSESWTWSCHGSKNDWVSAFVGMDRKFAWSWNGQCLLYVGYNNFLLL